MQLTKCPQCEATWRIRGVELRAPVKCPFCEHEFAFKPLAGTTVRIDREDVDSAMETTEVAMAAGQDLHMPTEIPSHIRLRLEMLNPSHQGRVVELSKSRITVGRGESDIELNDSKTSRKHFAIEYYSEDNIIVKDLASTNGTFVNNLRVAHARLQDGDIIRAGSNEMKFRLERI